MLTDDLDYTLPEELIATEPARPRDAARLMVIHRETGGIEHRHVRDLPVILKNFRAFRGGMMVFNESKVIPAWFAGVRSGTGGRVTGLYLESPAAGRWSVMLESRGSLREGEVLELSHEARLVLVAREGAGQWLARLESEVETLALLERIGSPPLPPYIRQRRKALHLPGIEAGDVERYNTVYAREPGSVAAPTAGLHFTPELLAALTAGGVERASVTLHVGLGTFAPIRTKHVEDHPIHREWFSVPPEVLGGLAGARAAGKKILVVGTTTVRALESLPEPLPGAIPGGYEGQTGLFIRPAEGGEGGFGFRFTDALMTNFHLPRSSLLALVAALPGVGVERLKGWYRVAVEEGYRFYSYGDAMVIL